MEEISPKKLKKITKKVDAIEASIAILDNPKKNCVIPHSAVDLGIVSDKLYNIHESCTGSNSVKEIAELNKISEEEAKETIIRLIRYGLID